MKLFLKDYENFIYKTARSYYRKTSCVELDDLVQAGWLGLLEAYERYDESYQNKFLTYASFYVTKHMQEAIHKNNVVEFPRDIIRMYFRIENAKNEIVYKDHEEVTVEKVAEKTKLPIKKIQKYEAYFVGFHTLSDYEELEAPELDDVRFETIKGVLNTLPETHKNMLLDRLEGKNLTEMGREYNLCAERVRQVLNEIITKLKRRIENELS
jgi:RNA polymerase sigma factor (sigma-70 family)